MTMCTFTRRAALAAASSALMIGVVAPAVAADDAAAAKVAAAVESLRTAMFAGDGKTLAALTWDQLVYTHSNGRLENKAAYIKSLDGLAAFKALVQTDQTIEVVADTAIVRHTFDSINSLPDGKTNTAHIRVMQIWKLDNGAWKLLARASTPLPQ